MSHKQFVKHFCNKVVTYHLPHRMIGAAKQRLLLSAKDAKGVWRTALKITCYRLPH